MANGNLGLGFLFSAKDLATNVIRRVGTEYQTMLAHMGTGTAAATGKLQAFAGVSMMTAGAAGVLASAVGAAKLGGAYERLINTAAVVTNASKEQKRQMEDLAYAVGGELPVDAAEATKSLVTLGQAGYSATQAMKMLKPTLQLAAASGGELSADKAATVMNQIRKVWGFTADEMAARTNQLASATAAFAIDFKELPLMLGNAARGASTVNADFEQTIALLGLTKNVIPGTERAATAVAVLMERMANPKAQKELKKLGIAVQDAKGNFIKPLELLKELYEKTGGMSEVAGATALAQILGARAAGAGVGILNQMRKGIEDDVTGQLLKGGNLLDSMLKKAQGQSGDLARIMEAKMKNFAGSMEMTKTAWSNLVTSIGQDTGSVLGPILGGFAIKLEGLGTIWRSLPSPVRHFAAALTIAASALLMATGVVLVAKIGLSLFSITALVAVKAVGALMLAMLPIVAIVAGVAVGVYAFYKALQHLFGVDVGAFWDKLMLVMSGAKQMVETGRITGETATKLVNNLEGGGGLLGIVMTISTFVEAVRNFFTELGVGFRQGIDEAAPAFNELKESFLEIRDALWGDDKMNPVANAERWLTFGAAGRAVGKAFAFVAEIIVWVLQPVMALAAGLTETLVPGFKIVGKIIEVWIQPAFAWIVESITGMLKSMGLMSEAGKKNVEMLQVLGFVAKLAGWIIGGTLAIALGLVAVVAAAVVGTIGAIIWAIKKVVVFLAEHGEDIADFFGHFGLHAEKAYADMALFVAKIAHLFSSLGDRIDLAGRETFLNWKKSFMSKDAYQEQKEILDAQKKAFEEGRTDADMSQAVALHKKRTADYERVVGGLRRQRERERVEAGLKEPLDRARQRLNLPENVKPAEVAVAAQRRSEVLSAKASSSSLAPVEAEERKELLELMRQLKEASMAPQPVQVNATLVMDGEVAARSMAKKQAEEQGMSFTEAPAY
jgi:TP901 family phage tail tape measure protein